MESKPLPCGSVIILTPWTVLCLVEAAFWLPEPFPPPFPGFFPLVADGLRFFLLYFGGFRCSVPGTHPTDQDTRFVVPYSRFRYDVFGCGIGALALLQNNRFARPDDRLAAQFQASVLYGLG